MGRLLVITGIYVVTVLLTTSPTAGQLALRASGGAFSNPSGPPCTLHALVWQIPEAGAIAFVLHGPSAWNNGVPMTWSVTQGQAGTRWDIRAFCNIPAVAGAYTLSARVGGSEVTTTFSVALSPLLPPTSIRVTVQSRDRISVEWRPIDGAVSYQVDLTELPSRRRLRTQVTRGTTHSFEGTPYLPGRYRARVTAFNLDATQPVSAIALPAHLMASEAAEEFDIR